MNTNDLRAIKSKRDIETAFINLITQKDFDKITIKDICSEALIGRSTFYRYYEDKYDLLNKLILKYSQILDDLLAQRMKYSINNDLLSELYTGLNKHKDAILSLLKLSFHESSLEINFKKILIKHMTNYLHNFNFKIPELYIQQLYAANVMTAIIWSLKYGADPQIAHMMNDIFQHLTKNYATKVVK